VVLRVVLLPSISASAHLTIGSEKKDGPEGPRKAAAGGRADESVGVLMVPRRSRSADNRPWSPSSRKSAESYPDAKSVRGIG